METGTTYRVIAVYKGDAAGRTPTFAKLRVKNIVISGAERAAPTRVRSRTIPATAADRITLATAQDDATGGSRSSRGTVAVVDHEQVGTIRD